MTWILGAILYVAILFFVWALLAIGKQQPPSPPKRPRLPSCARGTERHSDGQRIA